VSTKKNNPSLGRDQLLAKYGAEIFENPPAMTRSRLEKRLAEWDAIDQYFTKTSFDFAAGMQRRKVLDNRMRWLIQIGQFTATKSFGHLEDTLRAAIEGGVVVREALESILLCQVYAGDTALVPALEIFTRVADDLGVLTALRDDQLPLDGHDSTRSLEAERKTWKPEEENYPAREALMKKYGWQGVSSGIKYRGVHHLNLLNHRAGLDPEWAGLWLQFTYQRMYSRWILDDKTRVLCTVGDTFAVGDFVQARDHMAEALNFGVTPRELMEIVFLVGIYFGSPKMGASLKVFEGLIAEKGRMAEIGDPPPMPEAKKK
jgi:alkylhydroperoxidase/carboxymuconolactone decarboxylase family protein YurZ